MKKNSKIIKILMASLLVGLLQYLYNVIVASELSLKILPTFFEGTFMFIIVALVFIYIKKDIFKNWIIFSISLSLIHSLLMLIPVGLHLVYFISFFIGKLLMIVASVKFIDYAVKD